MQFSVFAAADSANQQKLSGNEGTIAAATEEEGS